MAVAGVRERAHEAEGQRGAGARMTMRTGVGRWWVVARPNPAATLRLLCFPHAGGSASTFHAWHANLPAEAEVRAAQLPGRANRIAEPAFKRIGDLVEEIGATILPLADRPIALFGHSMGAIVSFEIARWLRRHRGVEPAHLFVSGRRAPHLPDRTNPPRYLANDDDLLAKLAELDGTPADVFRDPELFKSLVPTLRADFEVVETYDYAGEPPLDCPITAFGGHDDTETHDGRLDAWQSQTTRTFSRHFFDGGHFFLQS